MFEIEKSLFIAFYELLSPFHACMDNTELRQIEIQSVLFFFPLPQLEWLCLFAMCLHELLEWEERQYILVHVNIFNYQNAA